MRILVIDDNKYTATKLAEALAEIGEVEVCSAEPFNPMPPKDQVIASIGKADLVLLDGKIGPEYDGPDLFPHCSSKKVLGISTRFNFGEHNWHGKERLAEGRVDAVESLRKKVREMLAQ